MLNTLTDPKGIEDCLKLRNEIVKKWNRKKSREWLSVGLTTNTLEIQRKDSSSSIGKEDFLWGVGKVAKEVSWS